MYWRHGDALTIDRRRDVRPLRHVSTDRDAIPAMRTPSLGLAAAFELGQQRLEVRFVAAPARKRAAVKRPAGLNRRFAKSLILGSEEFECQGGIGGQFVGTGSQRKSGWKRLRLPQQRQGGVQQYCTAGGEPGPA